MYNINGIRLVVERFWKLGRKDRLPKAKYFPQKMHSMSGAQCFPWSKSNLQTEIEWQTKHWTIVSRLLPLTLVLTKER